MKDSGWGLFFGCALALAIDDSPQEKYSYPIVFTKTSKNIFVS